jgi:catechol-2,3-dioxygenase
MNRSDGPSRREFMRAAAGLTAAALAGCAPEPGARGVAQKAPERPVDGGILQLALHTPADTLDATRRFYGDTLGLPVTEPSAGTLAVQAGGTAISFEAVHAGRPYYHFAFNIPENMLPRAKEWLRPRCPLVRRPDGSDEYHFVSWNAHSVYFLDPAGNILEFIARHNLRNARPAGAEFSPKDILYASEIAVVVDDVGAAAENAGASLGLRPFAGSISRQFAALGDDHRLLIVVKRGREWNSGHGRTAEVYPLRATIRGAPGAVLHSADLGFTVAGA